MASTDGTTGGETERKEKENKMPDFEPPMACVQRIIKGVLPDSCQITKESKTAFSKAAGIFIIYLTTCANDFCKEGKRSTISSADVLAALRELEFHDLIGPLEEFLAHYRQDTNAKKELGNSSAKAAHAITAVPNGGGNVEQQPDSGIGEEASAEEAVAVTPPVADSTSSSGVLSKDDAPSNSEATPDSMEVDEDPEAPNGGIGVQEEEIGEVETVN
uniref:Transcription factor CBF/NF-Y/archaeal histone domain-containing protein n=1 Tax=Octactis speculum TaxID=3111310 RepID=A0A7S2DWQ9_9STRA|mmetsp:Transcript_54421/g.74392  ORF Transcript_54421/g.74392 Transcript_54421/m.74392 type:complete len:217 (+) Transcript_54421:39-689(+)|eukprot:CAMPEP_0185780304 /NCGR_PEP_ID=MMETSP1174-20130828/98678_1 /TAXON_ID=35687 /ORGANISM="Dictyocha speculum, Strain CCMP1381" /LENGTH=216 /DNA_ID=CAMNT_0028469813 /DNA_START=39 /DNA_END=689 /DNA_ORIENTATION=+